MARVLRMPGVAANETDGVLSEWLVEESGEFATADPIATVETEKAAVDIEADAAGRVLKTLVPPGAQVEVGAPIAVLADAGEQVDDLEALLVSLGVAPATDVVVPQRRDVPSDPESAAPVIEDAGMPAVPPSAQPASAQPASAQPASAQPASGSPASGPPAAANGRVFASPLARKIAGDHGLPMEEIHGTGPRGRVLRRDVEAALESRSARPPAHDGSPAPDSSPRSAVAAAYEEIPHSRIRLATARRLTASQQEVPHFYLRTTVRAEALLALRAELNEDAETRITVTDLVVKAVGSAHRRVPEMNVTWTPEAVRRYRTVDVAVAVATERGLVTPVIRDVGSLPVTAVTASLHDLSERARTRRLKQEELEGGAISVTNLGMYGVEEFAAIINPPHAAILAVGALRSEPVVEGDAVVNGQVMSVTLSVDHRPVDGVLAARWLAVLKELLQRPARILA